MDPWDITNVKGDCLALVAHFVFWTLVLILIESGASCSKCCKRRKMKKTLPNNIVATEEDTRFIDEDVAREAERVNSLAP